MWITYSACLREMQQTSGISGLTELIGEFFRVVTNDGQFVISSFACGNQHKDPAGEHDHTQCASNRSEVGNPAEHILCDAQGAEQENGLHRIKAYIAILPLQEQEDDAANPAEDIT